MKNSNILIKYFGAIMLFCICILPLQAQKNVIFDTDMGPDCDDAGALAILHAMADKGEVNILAIASCIGDPNSAPTIDAINTYYGRPNIPIGTLKDVGFLPGPYSWIKELKDFPNDLQSGTNAPDAVQLYRQTLAAQPDNSVTLISVGPLRNIKNLLQSAPDSYSNLNGLDLVAKKVKTYTLMGGQFFSGGSEYNMNQDGQAAEYVINNFPSNIEMIFSQMHIGSNINTGGRLSAETPATNPVRKAYELYSGIGKNNASWDQTAVLYAIRGLGAHWKLETNGYCYIESTGYTDWRTNIDKNQSLINWLSHSQSMTAVIELAIIIEDLMLIPPLNSGIDFPVTSVSLNKTSSMLTVGESLSLVATVLPTNATINGVSWSSSNTAVAKVSTSGVVTAVGFGSATITVTTSNGGKKAICEITTKVLGSASAEYWTGFPGTEIPTTMPTKLPNQIKDLYSLEAPVDFADEYLIRISGYIIPTTTGTYNFYISSDDNGALWLSSNADPVNITKIAIVEDYTAEGDWDKSPNQKSSNKSLEGGKKYYFEAIMKEGGGGDHLAIGWTGPGITSVTVIGGANVGKYINGVTENEDLVDVLKTITIHPNPANNVLFISGNFLENATYEITSIEGKSLQTGALNGGTISLSNLISGLYLIKIKTEAGDRVQRFVKE